MFTGIVQGQFEVAQLTAKTSDPMQTNRPHSAHASSNSSFLNLSSNRSLPESLRLVVRLPDSMVQGLERGASVSVDGVCLTVTGILGMAKFGMDPPTPSSPETIDSGQFWLVSFDVIRETLEKSTLSTLKPGSLVNIERAARLSAEVGGHHVSGHVYGIGSISKIDKWEGNQKVTFQIPPSWTKYFLPKGYIAIDGISLTLVDVDPNGAFTVHLIPETLARTSLGRKGIGDLVNIELDSQTQAIVDTVERVLNQKGLHFTGNQSTELPIQ